MKRFAFFVFSYLFTLNFSLGQDMAEYRSFIKEAWSLYESKDFAKSAEKYEEAFSVLEGKAYPNDRYNAACSHALSGNADSSFYHLFRLATTSRYKNYGHITTDTDLNSLHKDPRWKELIDKILANKTEAEKNLDKPLVALLDTIYREDQKYRKQIDGIAEKHGWKSKEVSAHWKIINKKDSLNLIEVMKILDERGWLGPDIIGDQGNSTLFLVIQHSDLEIQEKYLPMMREAVKKGNASASGLALLEDRVALRKGGKQIYGSQVGRDPDTEEYEVRPLIDPDNVNKRRTEVGLGPIEDYVSRWGIIWDVEAFKKKMAATANEK